MNLLEILKGMIKMKPIKFRQKLKPEYFRSNGIYHYWGYIDKGFTSPVGKNFFIGESEQFTGYFDYLGFEIYDRP
tara:strand:- start:32 stop:256 length:225 start_codon:yes stop_codon:yes gene_type:complete